MVLQLSRILRRAPAQVLEDMIGLAAIFVILFIALSLPGLI